MLHVTHTLIPIEEGGAYLTGGLLTIQHVANTSIRGIALEEDLLWRAGR